MPTDAAHDFYAALGLRVRARRSVLGLTQYDLADAIHISRDSIANLETGRRPTRAHTLAAIATALGCEVADLMPGAPISDGDSLVKIARALHATLGEFLDQFDDTTPTPTR